MVKKICIFTIIWAVPGGARDNTKMYKVGKYKDCRETLVLPLCIRWRSGDIRQVVTGSHYRSYATVLHLFCVAIDRFDCRSWTGQVWTGRPGNRGLWHTTLSACKFVVGSLTCGQFLETLKSSKLHAVMQICIELNLILAQFYDF